MNNTTIHELIREAKDNYVDSSVDIGDYVSFDMYDTIQTIDAYLNSKHISGEKDALGREKPFFNIVTAAANIWYRATDLDRKNVRFLPSNIETTGQAFIATVLLQQWMRDARFGTFLNEWGRVLARYGSAVVKFVEQDGELIASTIPWNRLIVDQIDFDSLPTIEKFYLTPAQLKRNKIYNQEVVRNLMDAKQNRETLDNKDQDDNSNFIELYEVHGLLPLSLLTDNEKDAETYVQQMHVVSYISGKDGKFNDYTLYSGREKKHPYMITHLIKEDGRTLAIGAVEHLFNAQWMVNHSQKNIKDTLDIASKLIMQTADKKFAGRNMLTQIETGDIFVHDDNKPLTRVANDKPDITAFQNFQAAWQNIANEIVSTPDALKGQTLPSGTPYSLGAYLGAQANSLFEIMTENKGLHLEDMMREFVIPFLKKKMDTTDEIMAILEADAITEIDTMFIPREAKRRYNQEAKEQLINGEVPSPYQSEVFEGQVKQQLGELGSKRSFKPSDIDNKTWKASLEGLENRLIVEVTNEETDKQAVLTTLSTVLQTIAGNPAILQDPNARMIFNAILTETGKISPIQLSSAQSQPTASPPNDGGRALADLTKNNVNTTTTSPT